MLCREQAGQQRNEGNADHCHTTARHELLHALALCAGVIVAVTFHQVDCTPNAQASATTRVCKTSIAELKNAILCTSKR